MSLRTFLVAVALVAAWLGMHVERTNRQREAVAALVRLDVYVYYSYQQEWVDAGYSRPGFAGPPESPIPPWLRAQLGDDFFHTVTTVTVSSDVDVDAVAVELKRLPGLRNIYLPIMAPCGMSLPSIMKTLDDLQAAVPEVKVSLLQLPPIVG